MILFNLQEPLKTSAPPYFTTAGITISSLKFALFTLYAAVKNLLFLAVWGILNVLENEDFFVWKSSISSKDLVIAIDTSAPVSKLSHTPVLFDFNHSSIILFVILSYCIVSRFIFNLELVFT